MARKTKEVVIEELVALGVSVEPDAKYNDLCKSLKEAIAGNLAEEQSDEILPPGPVPQDEPTGAGTPNQIEITNRLKKRPVFMADAVRDERDKEFLNKEIGQRQYKGRLLRVTTVKEYEVSDDGFWITKFTIELKD